jgi:hypothetical protein
MVVRIQGGGDQYEVLVEIDGVRAGARPFPRAMEGTPVKGEQSGPKD